MGQTPFWSYPSSTWPLGSPGAATGMSLAMRLRTSPSSGLMWMKYDDVQQPTHSPHATSVPPSVRSAFRAWRNQDEKLPAGRSRGRFDLVLLLHVVHAPLPLILEP